MKIDTPLPFDKGAIVSYLQIMNEEERILSTTTVPYGAVKDRATKGYTIQYCKDTIDLKAINKK